MPKVRMLIALAATVLLPAQSSPSPFGTGWFDGADPDINLFTINGIRTFVVYTTSTAVWTSPDMIDWTFRGKMLDIKNNPDDVPWLTVDRQNRGLWAPDMVAANGKFYLYFSVGPQTASYRSEIGLSVCLSPLPPCQKTPGGGRMEISAQANYEAIDPAFFQDPKDGQRYLYTGGSNGGRLRVFRLASDMKTIEGEASVPQPANFTEAAFMHTRVLNGVRTYYLSYSNGSWNRDDYNVKYVTGPSATGPWSAPRTILATDDRYKGPGHHSFLFNPDTQKWTIAYHRWEGKTGSGPYDGPRRTAMARIRYTGTAIDPVDMEATDTSGAP